MPCSKKIFCSGTTLDSKAINASLLQRCTQPVAKRTIARRLKKRRNCCA